MKTQTTAERAQTLRMMADMHRDEAHAQAAAMISLRDSLRRAFDMANRSGYFASQDGVYGLVDQALTLMGEAEAVEVFCNSCEWPQD